MYMYHQKLRKMFDSSSNPLEFLSSFFELAGIFVALEILLNHHGGVRLHEKNVKMSFLVLANITMP